MAMEGSIDDMNSYEPLKIEADEVVKEVAFAVKSVEISTNIRPIENEVYLNLCTLEGLTFCVELSVQGFRVVGSVYDTVNETSNSHFETIYSLLDSLSPGYRQTFADTLLKKLTMLESNNVADEAMLQD